MDNRALSHSESPQNPSAPLTRSNRSGGPQTPEGKAKTSQNALKTGVYSARPLLPDESEADFEELVSLFCQDLQVVGPVESMYAQQLAGLAWRRMRLEQLEYRITLEQLARCPTLEEFRKVGLAYPALADNYLIGIAKITDDEVPGYRERLKQVKGYKENGLDLEELKRLQADDPVMFEWIAHVAEESRLTNPTPERIASAKSGLEGKEKPLLQFVLDRIRREIEGMLWIPDHQTEIDAAIAKVRDLRVMELMQMNRSKRAFDDLAREFDRTLAQLHKQQDWRLRRAKIIDITPTSREIKQNV